MLTPKLHKSNGAVACCWSAHGALSVPRVGRDGHLPPGQRRGVLDKPRSRGFQSGAANFRVIETTAKKARKAAKAAEKAAARALLVQRFHPEGLPVFSGKARTQPLTERELALLKLRAAAPTPPCITELAAELGRCEATIKRGLKRVLEPETPRTEAEERHRKGGRPRTLTQEESATLRAAFEKDPLGGPAEAAKVLFEVCGKRPSPWTIRRELRRTHH